MVFFLSITLLLHGVQEQNNGADRITCLASKLTLKTNELQQYFVFCKMRNRSVSFPSVSHDDVKLKLLEVLA